MTEAGWLYVLEIPALPGVVKVGRTARDPSLRCRELGGADCPFELVVAWKKPVPDAPAAERQAHRMLVAKRLKRADRVLGHASFAGCREFYQADLQDVMPVLEVITAPPQPRKLEAATTVPRPEIRRPRRSRWSRPIFYRTRSRRIGRRAIVLLILLLAGLMTLRPDVSFLPQPIAQPLQWLEMIG